MFEKLIENSMHFGNGFDSELRFVYIYIFVLVTSYTQVLRNVIRYYIQHWQIDKWRTRTSRIHFISKRESFQLSFELKFICI